jgi:hypothetical protein
VEGLRGIYIASQVAEDSHILEIGPEHLVTVISFDNGGEWRRISAPSVDEQGRPIKCDEVCVSHETVEKIIIKDLCFASFDTKLYLNFRVMDVHCIYPNASVSCTQ